MDLHRLFFPESIAVVGASPNIGPGRVPYYQLLKSTGYKGRLYAVNPRYNEIDGETVYQTIEGLPGPIDLVIATIPAGQALDVVKSCAEKGVKFIHFFTSGFSEIGDKGLEKAMIDAARLGGVRIIGPNCMGVHCSEAGISCDLPNIVPLPAGKTAFLGQSGGMTNNFMRMAQSKQIMLNKVVSYGNQIDLKVEDYLEYFAHDDTVQAISCYIEDIKDMKRFTAVLKRNASQKPVIILKGGTTEQGAKAAASHTGAMAARNEIWTALMRQYGCIQAQNFEHMIDLAMMAVSERMPTGPRLGFLGAGGGTSVLFTDIAYSQGFTLPELNPQTQERISEKISNVNTSTSNPVDLGFFGFDFTIMAHTISAMAEDDRIDIIIPYFSLDFITSFQRDQLESGPYTIIEAAQKTNKPVVPILSKFTENSIEIEEVRIKMSSVFRDAGLPVYNTPQDALASLRGLWNWIMYTRDSQKTKD